MTPVVAFSSHLSKRGEINPLACLSQWHPSPIEEGRLHFPTAEHYMMHGKAVLFGDEASAQAILRAPSPFLALELGRMVKGYDEALWIQHRRNIVLAGNLQKFRQSPKCRQILLGTAPSILAFASGHDLVWGTGLSSVEHAASQLVSAWPGENLLGQILTQVRTLLSAS